MHIRDGYLPVEVSVELKMLGMALDRGQPLPGRWLIITTEMGLLQLELELGYVLLLVRPRRLRSESQMDETLLVLLLNCRTLVRVL